MKNTILTLCMMFSGLCLARIENPTEIPIYRAVLSEVQNDRDIDENRALVLTMYKLVNSTNHPSSFTLCCVCQEEKCKAQQCCKKFFLAKQKEALRCFSSRFTATEGARSEESLVVDESMGEDAIACSEENASILDELKLVWNVRTYIDGNLDRSYKGYPVPVR